MFPMQTSDCQSERGLQPGNAERRTLELDHLLVCGMWGLVSSNGVHSAVGECHQNGFTIRRRTQWRVHLEIGIVVANVGVKQRKVMRSYFARDPRLRALAAPHCLERVSSRNMRHMQTRSRKLLRQLHIALHDRGLCRGLHTA